MKEKEGIKHGLEIMDKLSVCLLGSNDDDGYPNIKAMSNRRHEGIKKIWFNTDTSSKRVQQFRNNNKACVYFLDKELGRGLMLIGTMEILQNIESKKMVWKEEDEVFRPLGLEDPEFTVLCFTSEWGEYVDAIKNDGVTFETK
ncbi:MAG: pyridoxamine 5'-phosphate oxidase family protein [Dehalococcoidales bacterium]|nr:MAG: pyridoxamine 5'-phosphate oxidase family protein [Dehalococcoidales bacterium]